jgi:DNA repair ATPase RecN
MPADRVEADPKAVRKLASALTQYHKTVTEAAKSVQSALSNADWNDSQKQQFEARLKQLNESVRRFMDSDVKDMIAGLNKLASQLEAVRQIRM